MKVSELKDILDRLDNNNDYDVVVKNDRLYEDGYYSATEVIVEDGNIIIETDYEDMVDEL